jgi:hypothetical protein
MSSSSVDLIGRWNFGYGQTPSFRGIGLFGSIHLPVAQSGGAFTVVRSNRCVQTPSITGKLCALIHGQFKGLGKPRGRELKNENL